MSQGANVDEEYPTVTLDDLRTQLPDLLRRVADGEELVVMDGGRPVVTLAPPPDPPLSPEQEAAALARFKKTMKEWIQRGIEEGIPLRPGSPLEVFLQEEA